MCVGTVMLTVHGFASTRSQGIWLSQLAMQHDAPSKETMHEMHASTREQATRFAEFDQDGNQQLDFEEFLAMQPRKIRETHSAAEIRTWFESADLDGDGTDDST